MALGNVSTQRLVPAGTRRPDAPSERRRRGGARVVESGPDELLRPRTVGRILDESFELLVRHGPAVVGVAMLLWLPIELGIQAILATHADEGYLLGNQLLEGPMRALVAALVCSLIRADLAGEPISLGESLRRASSRWLGLIVISIVTVVLGVPATCLCVFPVVLVYWLLATAPPIHVIERVGVAESLRRSVMLAWGWEGFGLWLGSWIGMALFVLPIAAVTGGLANPTSRDMILDETALSGLGFGLGAALVCAVLKGIATGFPAVVATVYYVDRRVRREGLDLQVELRRMELGARPGGGR